jgi:hypothetical protein
MFELKALNSLGRHSTTTTWATLPALKNETFEWLKCVNIDILLIIAFLS